MAAQYKVYLTCRYPLCKDNGPYSMWTMQEHMAYHIKHDCETTEHFSMRCTVKDCNAFFIGKMCAEEHAKTRSHTVVPTFNAIIGKTNGSLKFHKAMMDYAEPLSESKKTEAKNRLEQPQQSQEHNASSQEKWVPHSPEEDDPYYPHIPLGYPSAPTYGASFPGYGGSATYSQSSFGLLSQPRETPRSPSPPPPPKRAELAVEDITSAIEALVNDADPAHHDLRLQNRPDDKSRERIDSGFSEQPEGSPQYNLKRPPGYKRNMDTSNDERGVFIPRKKSLVRKKVGVEQKKNDVDLMPDGRTRHPMADIIKDKDYHGMPRRRAALGLDAKKDDAEMMSDGRTRHPLAGVIKVPYHEQKSSNYDTNRGMGVNTYYGDPHISRCDAYLGLNNAKNTYMTGGRGRLNDQTPFDRQRTKSASFVDESRSMSARLEEERTQNRLAMKKKGPEEREVDLVVHPFRSSIPPPPGFGSGNRRSTMPPLRYETFYAETVTSPQNAKKEEIAKEQKKKSDSPEILCLDDKPIAPLDEPDAFSTAVQDGRDSDGEEVVPRPLFPPIKREEPSPDPDPVDVVPPAHIEANKQKKPEKNLCCVFNNRFEGRGQSIADEDIKKIRSEMEKVPWGSSSGFTRKRHLDDTGYKADERALPPPANSGFLFINIKSPDYRQKRSSYGRRSRTPSPPPARRRRSPSPSYGNRPHLPRRRSPPPPRSPEQERRRRSPIRERSYSRSPRDDI